MSDTREVARAALAVLEQNRRRIDDLNVYPVPDGDTGTNLTLTMRAVVEALDASAATDGPTLAREASRAALMGARGNSGVIFSQILRGAAEVLAGEEAIASDAVARALRAASDAAYRAVRRPVEGTMLTVIRELAEEAEGRRADALPELLDAVVARGEQAVVRTTELLDVLRDADVVDAGGAGLLELVRGAAAALTGAPLPEAPPEEELAVEAIHQELSRYRYCTTFVVEGHALDVDALEDELERLGDSLLVVGDRTALKVHVHTDDPGAALSLGTRVGAIAAVEIANMHAQTTAREERLLYAVPDEEPPASEVVAVVAGDGNRRLFASLGASRIVTGGQTMNPSTAELVSAIEACRAGDVLVLPNNSNVIMSAEQAASVVAEKHVEVVAADSIPAGLAAMVAFDSARPADENAAEMRAAVAGVVTGEVTIASRDVEMDGVSVRMGSYLGLANGAPVAGGTEFDDVAAAVIDQLLAEPRDVLTLLTGDDEPQLGSLLARVRAQHPALEVDVQAGGQPHYPLLVSAE
jgi:DAK2 domain fusion protein YloV